MSLRGAGLRTMAGDLPSNGRCRTAADRNCVRKRTDCAAKLCRNASITFIVPRSVMSIWWVVGAFVVGGYAGMLLHALLTMAATREKATARALRSLEVDGISSLNVETR